MRGGYPLHAFQRLDSALRLLRLGGLGTESVDERLQMRDLALLLRVRGLLQRELLRALALELRIVAGVGPELQPIDMHDRIDDPVQEIAVVRDEDKRPRVAREPVLEPQHGIEIEMVRRLVQEEQIRAACERLSEIQAHPPAAGKARHGVAMESCRKAEPREQRRRPGGGRIAADGLEAVVEFRECLTLEPRIDCGRSSGGG